MLLEIKNDIKQAMKDKDAETRDTLRGILAKAQNFAMTDKRKNATDEDVLKALNSELKQIETNLNDSRIPEGDFLEKNRKDKELLLKYLPKQMSEDEIREYVNKVVFEKNITNRGQAMKLIMAELKGKANGKVVGKIVGEILG